MVAAARDVLVGWLVLAVPVLGALRYRRLAAVTAGPDGRLRAYRRSVRRQWALAAVAVGLTVAGGDPVGRIGLRLGGAGPHGLLTSLAVAVGAGLALALALRHQARRRPDRALSERLLRPVGRLLPRSPRERRWFAAVAVTAGVTEELLYRGFLLLWLRGGPLHLGTGTAVVTAAVVFGVAHAYQGPVGMAGTGLAGFVLASVYVQTASLLVPVVLHALLDLRVLLVLRPGPAGSQPTEAPVS